MKLFLILYNFKFKIKLIKDFFIKVFILIICKSSLDILIYLSRTNIKSSNFEEKKKLNYLNEYNKLKDKYKTDLFLNSFLKEISIISYDYSNELTEDNN